MMSDDFLTACEESDSSISDLGVLISFLPYVVWIFIRTALIRLKVIRRGG